MALYQPSNIVPSSFGGIGNGTVAVSDNINISWQINGNSALIAFQIDVYKNTALSELVYSTGIITDNCPAYGVDNKGNPTFFKYSPNQNWSSWGLLDGDNYKIGITQFYSSVQAQTLYYTLTGSLSVDTQYYLNYQYQYYLGFTPDENNVADLSDGTVIYYNITDGIGWYFKNNILTELNVSYSEIHPNSATYLGDMNEVASSDTTFYHIAFTPQYSDSAIITRGTPSILINTINSVVSVKYTFSATYSQSQGDTLNWVQWKLNLIDTEGNYILIDDTGAINTSILSYTYDGFLNGNTYEIICIIETENGIQAESIAQFTVSYDEESVSNIISMSCNNSDGSILLNWEKPSQTNIVSTAVYRRNQNNQLLQILGNLSAETTQIKDYGLVSGEKYSYEIFFVNKSDEYSVPIRSNQVCTQYKYYSLIEATQDVINPNVYHALQTFKFGNNINISSTTNNNTPNWLTNFTKYRLKQPSVRMGKSGMLQALLNNVNSSNTYKDSAKMMEKVFALSESLNTFFLKDMKGNLYMVGISNPIEQTINISSTKQEVTISIPWEEIGDASNISIIQTPLDEGWGNSSQNMILQVTMSVNPSTGELIVNYPTAYVGTRFNLNKASLVSTTPDILNQPEFSLSEGILTAILEE